MVIKARDLTAAAIAEARSLDEASTVISDLFQISNSSVRQNWRKNQGSPKGYNVDEWVDFRKQYEGVSRGSNDTPVDVRKRLDLEKLRNEQIKGDTNELALAEVKRNLYQREGVERMMGSMKDTIENLLLRMCGTLLIEMEKTHKGKIPAKTQRAIRDAFPAVIDDFNKDLAEEGRVMVKDIRKRAG